MSGEESLFQDTHFWVLLSTLLFVLVVAKKGKKPILKVLDDRTNRIKNDLEEAARLRTEAEDLLADCQRKHRDAVQTAQKIIDGAKSTADRLRTEAETKLNENLDRREAQLLARISRAEAAAVQELRQQAASLASSAAEELLRENLPKSAHRLVDEAIRDIPATLN